jgi:chemotaxis-related protein WspB
MLLLTFTAGTNRFAVDVTRVVEVVPRVELRKIAHAPAHLVGLLGYRGNIVPVFDLGLLLDAAPCRDRLSTRIILVNDAPERNDGSDGARDHSPENLMKAKAIDDRVQSLLGLVAENVSDLTEIRPENVVPIPVSLPQKGSRSVATHAKFAPIGSVNSRIAGVSFDFSLLISGWSWWPICAGLKRCSRAGSG